MELNYKLNAYFITALLSVVFAVVGVSYNAWRLEVTEDNNNIRTASFVVLTELAELEQIIYAAHYDKNIIDGSPRKGWVKVGLIVDLSSLINQSVEEESEHLKIIWSNNWSKIAVSREATDSLVDEIESVRKEIKLALSKLK